MPSLVLIKNYKDERPIEIKEKGLDKLDEVLEFVNVESLPPLIEFNDLTGAQIFRGYVGAQLFLILDAENPDENVLREFNASARENRYEGIYYEEK